MRRPRERADFSEVKSVRKRRGVSVNRLGDVFQKIKIVRNKWSVTVIRNSQFRNSMVARARLDWNSLPKKHAFNDLDVIVAAVQRKNRICWLNY
jgi:hypothetical protein